MKNLLIFISKILKICIVGLNSLDNTVNPCEDFYQFSCSKFLKTFKKPKYEQIWNPLIQTANELNEKVQKILQNTKSEDKLFLKAQLFYRSCKNSKNDNKNMNRLKKLINEFDGWPLASQNNKKVEKNWWNTLIRMTRLLGISPLIKIHVDIEYKNNTNYVLYLQPGDLIFPREILQNSEHYQKELQAYNKWIIHTINSLYPNPSPHKFSKQIVEFEILLARLRAKSHMKEIKISQLSEISPDIEWLQGFQNLFNETKVNVTSQDTIIIYNYDYFKNLVEILNDRDPDEIQNYLIWFLVRDLSRDTSQHLRNLNFFIDQAVLNVEQDIPLEHECAAKTIQYFDYVLLPHFVKNNGHLKMMKNVEEIVDNIKLQASLLIRHSSWLSEEGKLATTEKLSNMKSMFGYPYWIVNKNLLKNYYKNLKVTSDHFLNILQIKYWKQMKNLNRLHTVVKHEEWPNSIFDVNAYYSILQNAIFLPLGILSSSFFDSKKSKAYNYGRIGTLIAHEISHGFDTYGRKANQYGNIKQWLSKKDVENYEKYIDCDQNNEEIADLLGIKISFTAFQNLKHYKKYRYELGDSFEEQLFFINFAQMWCEIGQKVEIFEDHGLVNNRINNVVTGIPEFAKYFNCSNFDNKCPLF